MHVPWFGKPNSIKPPFLHSSFVVGKQPSTVKVTCATSVRSLAVLVNVPHSVGVATMVSVKGLVGVDARPPGHVTVFSLVLHW